MSEFSVIIPTLQRSDELHPLVEQCAAHPLVLEVLVINNAPEPLHWASPKVRVLQQAENIYVNPAWNLGAREARGKYLAILNDDVLFDPALFDLAAKWLRRPGVGIVGPNGSCFNRPTMGDVKVRPTYARPMGFGTAMFMRRAFYVPIPETMRIFHGDDWLFEKAPRRCWTFWDFPIVTEMEVTSGDPAFNPVAVEDGVAWASLKVKPSLTRRAERSLAGAARRVLKRA